MPDALALALERLGADKGAGVGLDEGWMPEETLRSVSRGCTAPVVPAARALAEARRVKGPYEIECLARSLQIAEEALDAVIQAIERGTTELEAATQFSAEVLKRGAWPFPPLVGIGVRSGIPAPTPTDAALRPGAVIRLDVGCVYKGYCSSVARTAVLGEPAAGAEEAYSVVHTALEAAIGAVRGGAKIRRALEAASEAARELGISQPAWREVGHGIGLERREEPALDNSEKELETGEVLCVETSSYDFGRVGLSARDTVLVTTGGGRALNRSHHGLVVLD